MSRDVAVRPATTDAGYALLRLPCSDGLHPVRRLLRLLPVHRRADADLELAHPAVGRGHGSVGITTGLLEGIDERRPARSAATGQPVGLVGDDAVDLAPADQVEQLAELRSVAATVAVARRRRRLDQLGDDVELQPGGRLAARLDLDVERRRALPRDRLPGVERGSTPKGRRRGPAIRARASRGSHDQRVGDGDGAQRTVRPTKPLNKRDLSSLGSQTYGVHQHEEHADRGAGAGVPAAGAAPAAAAGERRRRVGAGRRGDRAGPPGARRRDRVADHRAPGVAAVGPGRRRARGGGGELAAAGRRRGPGRAPARQVHDPAEGRRRPPDADARRRRLGNATPR